MSMKILFMIFSLVLFSEAKNLIIGSWNIRYASKNDSLNGNAWTKRLKPISEIIPFYNFDIIGFQEPLETQIKDLENTLPDYEVVQIDSVKYHPIFYKKDKIQLLEKGQFYFSENEKEAVRSWGAKEVRFCTWAKFKMDSVIFFVFNVHLDHKSNEARRQSSFLLNKKIKSLEKNMPVFLVGDFNATQERSPCKILLEPGLLKHASGAKKVYTPVSSFNNFDFKTNEAWNLDHIFASTFLEMERFGILNASYFDGETFRRPSDHLPLLLEVEMPEAP